MNKVARKTITFLCLVAVLLVASLAGATPGDVDDSGAINEVDASLVKDHLLERAALTGDALTRADANEDGVVDLEDVAWITTHFTAPVLDDLTITLPGDVPLVLVKIPAGSFQMGSPPDEQDRDSGEGPVHTVTIAYDFYMGKYELTKAQWTAVMGTTPWSGWPGQDDSVLDDPNSPAVWVSWNDAQSFVSALNAHITSTGQGPATMRLPSEAEWEYACRAGTTTRFYWGDDPSYTQIGDYAWYYDNAWNGGEPYAHVVGQKLPNAWGLYDMSGNALEWCQDDWHGDYNGAPTDGSVWGDGSASHRVFRKGSLAHDARYCRSAARNYQSPSGAGYGSGFRLATVR